MVNRLKRLDGLELRRAELDSALAAAPADNGLVMHAATPERFRRLVERLNAVLAQADTVERQVAREEFRALIRKVVVTPLPERGRREVTVVTELAALVVEGGPDRMTTLGAGTGFEPVTFRL